MALYKFRIIIIIIIILAAMGSGGVLHCWFTSNVSLHDIHSNFDPIPVQLWKREKLLPNPTVGRRRLSTITRAPGNTDSDNSSALCCNAPPSPPHAIVLGRPCLSADIPCLFVGCRRPWSLVMSAAAALLSIISSVCWQGEAKPAASAAACQAAGSLAGSGWNLGSRRNSSETSASQQV